MLVIGVITPSFHFSGFQAVMEQKKKKVEYSGTMDIFATSVSAYAKHY